MNESVPVPGFDHLNAKRWACQDIWCPYGKVQVPTGWRVFSVIPLPPDPDSSDPLGNIHVRAVLFSMEAGD